MFLDSLIGIGFSLFINISECILVKFYIFREEGDKRAFVGLTFHYLLLLFFFLEIGSHCVDPVTLELTK